MRHTNKSQYTEIADRIIYVIKSPLTDDCYVAHCREDLLMSVYRHHKYCERNATKSLCEGLKEQELHPCLFIMETVQCTKAEAYKYVVVWAKIISNAGYNVINPDSTNAYGDDLLEDNQKRYDDRKTIDVIRLLECSKCMVSTYNKKKCAVIRACVCSSNLINSTSEKRLREKEFRVRVSDEEYNLIQKNAAACDKTPVAYLRELGLNMCTLPIDLSMITDHTNVITSYRNAVNQLIFTIKKTGNYTPLDLEYILEKTKELLKLENKFLAQVDSKIEQIEKAIPEVVTEIVNKNINNKKSPGKSSKDKLQ